MQLQTTHGASIPPSSTSEPPFKRLRVVDLMPAVRLSVKASSGLSFLAPFSFALRTGPIG